MNRWAKNGTLDKIFTALQENGIIRVKVEAMSLDSTSVRVHPDGTGALKKTAGSPLANQEADGQQKFIWLPQMLEQH